MLSSKFTNIVCPSCGSQRIWKDGMRPIKDGYVQRYICRDCGYRFSISDDSEYIQKVHRQTLNRNQTIHFTRQVGVAQTTGMINLVEVESRTQEKAAGATMTQTPDPETNKGLITQYMAYLENEGYASNGYLERIRQLAKKGANLLDPEDVKSKIAKQLWKDGTKMLAVYAYDAMSKMLKIQWTPPKYSQEESLPFIPEEAELDQLIAASQSPRMRAFLQTLKETYADPGEALKLRWIDINASNNTITINRPVKGHNPRQLQVSNKLITMLNALPKNSERIFPTTYNSMHQRFIHLRRRVAKATENPRLRSISLTTFRHWGATMLYYYTRKILLVQKVLGHKNIESTMKYTKLIQFKDDEFDVETATTVEEAKELLKAGFEKADEYHGIHLYRRPKKFGPTIATAEA